MILTHAELESLIQAKNKAPHQLLGMHPLGDGSGLVVRAFLPDAAQVDVVPTHEKGKPRIKLERIHASGVYEGVAKGESKVYAYDLRVTEHGGRARQNRD